MSIASLWRGDVGPRVRVRAPSRVRSGSPVRLRLALGDPPHKLASAARAMATRHLPLVVAKVTIDRLAESRSADVLLPTVEDLGRLTVELAGAGVVAEVLPLPDTLDARTVRELHNLDVTTFADAFGLDPDEVEAWERSDDPGAAVNALLRTIAYAPNAVREARAVSENALFGPPREAAE